MLLTSILDNNVLRFCVEVCYLIVMAIAVKQYSVSYLSMTKGFHLTREGTNTGLDYWTDIFLAFTHFLVG